jgi:hypothetical protein
MRIKTLSKPILKQLVNDPIGQLLSRAGDVPLLITVPHGGWEKIPAVPYTRVKPPSITGDSSYNSSSVDTNTQLIAGYLMDSLIRRGIAPYVVMTKVQRRTLDFNRSWSHNIQSHAKNLMYKTRANSVYSLPYVAPRLKYRYDSFFEQIDVFQNQIKANFHSKISKALHIDLHGTSLETSGDFAIGTLNGRSANSRIISLKSNRSSLESLFSTKGLKSSSRRGYLQGVHIMKQYGKSSGGFNSVQLELGTTCRATASDIKTAKTNEICAATAKKLVIAIHSWLNNNRVI